MNRGNNLKIFLSGFIFFILSVLLTGMVSCLPKTANVPETYEAKRGDIIQTVTASGSVNSSDEKNYSVQISGEVLKILKKGEVFKKGDTIIELDNSRAELLVSQAEENLKSAHIAIDIAKINYQQALDANHVAVQLAQSNEKLSEQATQNAFKSLEDANGVADASINNALIAIENANNYLKELKASPLATSVQIVQAEGSVDSAEAAYDQAVNSSKSQTDTAEGAYEQALNNQSISYWNNLNSTETAAAQIKLTKKSIEQAQNQLTLSEISLELAKLDLDKNKIIAPFDGVVLETYYSDGEYAGPGPAIFVISDDFIVKSDINETDISKILTGQEVDMTFDAYPDEHVMGKVSKISQVSKNTAGIITFEVTVVPESTGNTKMMHGFSANLEIITSRTENVLIVPVESVYEENGKKYVDMLDEQNKTTRKTEVATGASDYDNIEILSGLKEGDIIYTSQIESAQVNENQASGGGLRSMF